MRFSIIIPSWNNLKYLELCINSIKKNSNFEHDINVHLNEGIDGSSDFFKKNNIKFNISDKNVGLCSGANSAALLAETNYIVYSHDDMYFLPNWDIFLKDEVNKLNNNLYYFSGTAIGPIGSGLQNKETSDLTPSEYKNFDFDCGKNIDTFDEKKLLDNYKKVKYFDHQGSHWAPHLVHKSTWFGVGGFSEEFDPGFASDTDFNMKLWKHGVRIFKGINNSRVYHFGSMTTRKRENLKKNKGNKLFLTKWTISSNLFLKHYLKSNTQYDGPLNSKPNLTIKYIIEFIFCKIKYFLIKII